MTKNFQQGKKLISILAFFEMRDIYKKCSFLLLGPKEKNQKKSQAKTKLLRANPSHARCFGGPAHKSQKSVRCPAIAVENTKGMANEHLRVFKPRSAIGGIALATHYSFGYFSSKEK